MDWFDFDLINPFKLNGSKSGKNTIFLFNLLKFLGTKLSKEYMYEICLLIVIHND